jgi:hypothetical protein
MALARDMACALRQGFNQCLDYEELTSSYGPGHPNPGTPACHQADMRRGCRLAPGRLSTSGYTRLMFLFLMQGFR